MAVSLTGRDTRTLVPAAFCRTTSLKVTVARRRWGARARIPGGDSSTRIVPATARHLSGPIESGPSVITTSEQK